VAEVQLALVVVAPAAAEVALVVLDLGLQEDLLEGVVVVPPVRRMHLIILGILEISSCSVAVQWGQVLLVLVQALVEVPEHQVQVLALVLQAAVEE
jgi:hypothetical protein